MDHDDSGALLELLGTSTSLTQSDTPVLGLVIMTDIKPTDEENVWQGIEDLFMSSPATRALNTALIFLRDMNLPLATLHIQDNIYENNAAGLLKLIKTLDKQASRVMVFGHNPGFTDLANQLSSDMFFENVPTCGMVAFTFDLKKWQSAEFKIARLSYYQFPKNFRNIP